MNKLLFPLISMATLASALPAQISFTGNYAQNFNGLQNTPNVDANAAGAPGWTNNSTLPGWYGGGSATLAAGYGVGNGSDNIMLAASTTAVASFGTTANSDRALAPIKRNTIANIALALTNNTVATLTELTITYTGEQWRDNAAQAAGSVGLDFAYQVGAADISSGTWTNVIALNFDGPQTTGSGILDGNSAANRAIISSTISGLNVAVGQTIWLRWQQRTSGNNGSYVAIDDLTVVPEPSTYALLAGIMGLGLAILRRRERA